MARLDDALNDRSLKWKGFGKLKLPSGSVFLGDPFTDGGPPLHRHFKPGAYALEGVIDDELLVLLKLSFSRGKISSWEPATLEGSAADALAPGESCSITADSGLGMLLDGEAGASAKVSAERFEKFGDDVLDEEETAAEIRRLSLSLNVAHFRSESDEHTGWWGLDAKGEPVVLLIDFGLLELEPPAVARPAGSKQQERIKKLIKIIESEPDEDDPLAKDRAAESLALYGELAREAVAPLLETIVSLAKEGEDTEELQTALAALISEPELDLFVKQLARVPALIRTTAAMPAKFSAAVLPALSKHLASDDQRVVSAAAEALGARGELGALEGLRNAALAKNPAAVIALGKLLDVRGAPTTIRPALESALEAGADCPLDLAVKLDAASGNARWTKKLIEAPRSDKAVAALLRHPVAREFALSRWCELMAGDDLLNTSKVALINALQPADLKLPAIQERLRAAANASHRGLSDAAKALVR